MKVGTITTPNTKGQIVIPKAMRETLGIDAQTHVNLVLRGGGIYIYPIRNIIANGGNESSYAEILKKTLGAWRGDSWPRTEKRRRKIELKASKLRKKAW